MSLLHAADVHHDPPQPGVEALRLSQIASVSQSVGEGLLHCVPRTVAIPEHPKREREKAPVPVSIRVFDRGDAVGVRNRAHNSYDSRDTENV
jgi:hypothetical protein